MFLPNPDFSQNCILRVLNHETKDQGALCEASPVCGFGAVGPGGVCVGEWGGQRNGQVQRLGLRGKALGGAYVSIGLCALVISVAAADVPLPMTSDAVRSVPSSFPITRGLVLCDPVWEWRVARGLHLRARRCPQFPMTSDFHKIVSFVKIFSIK